MKLTSIARNAALVCMAAMLGLGAWIGYLYVSGNFHEVVPGKFYRSAQLSPEALGRYIDRYGIKTVINLRGENLSSDWYNREVEAVRAHNATFVNFRMSAKRALDSQQSEALIATMRDAETPILVHCQGGADRSGLASVMYLQQIAGVDEEAAEWQLSPLYGHINLPFMKSYAMDDTWEAFEKYIGLPS